MHNAQTTVTATLHVTPNFTGRVLVSLIKGEVQCDRRLRDDEHVSSLLTFLELAETAGFQVIPPEQTGE
ncbi:hypothetical protein [Rahnella sp. ChDrAdgB13]|uniref:hypothetical protein n=1 Tax=Rahnella sp. ChDrAdgB13 TaxID=1850581 RepID=UPI001AD87FE0|nr:hypothetical protein [Rahnella sp. ChDrAdgB13]